MNSASATLRIELYVPGVGPGEAFDLLVSELGEALPRAGLRLVPGPKGRVVEFHGDRETRHVAEVTGWTPGVRIDFSWHPADWEKDARAVPVHYTFDSVEGGSKIVVEYGEWSASTPLDRGPERVGWFASEVLREVIRVTAPLGFGDWWTDRVARRPSGAEARSNYADPMYHRPNFLLILERLHLRREDRLLEVGCGGGAFLQEALKSGCRAWAIDHSPEMVRLTREQNQQAVEAGQLDVREGDAHHLPFPDEFCTCAVTTGSFGFWEDPVRGLAEIRRVLRPDGRLILFTGTKELRGTPAAAEPVGGRVRFYEDEELAAMARTAKFTDIRVERPEMGSFARAAGLPPEAVEFFSTGPKGGQLLEARREKN